MEVRQIFQEYDFATTVKPEGARYCPRCGADTAVASEGGRERKVCTKCGFVDYRNPLPAVAVLVIDSGSVLLGRRGPDSFRAGLWCLPCGFIEFDEDFLTAAMRETKEETGLDVELTSIVNVAHNYLSPQFHTVVVVLTARPVGGNLCAGDDIEAVQWYPLIGPLPPMAFDSDRYIIERMSRGDAKGLPVQRI